MGGDVAPGVAEARSAVGVSEEENTPPPSAAATVRSGRWLVVDDIVVIVVAGVLGFWKLTLNALGNSYYTAASISGSQSLRGLFFASFDPGGVMAVDKPPLGLVGPSLAIRFFGLSSWTVLGPEAVMFVLGVLVAHRAFRRWFTPWAARLATAVVLLTPIDVAVARSNNPDELLVLTTIIGLVVLVESVRRDRYRWAALAGLCIGVGFATKQLQAVVGVPAALVALLVMSRGKWLRRAGRTAVYAVTAGVSSLVWIIAVDQVNARWRPYIANAANDTEFNLAFGFNGTHRVQELGGSASWIPSGHGWIARVLHPLASFLPRRTLLGADFMPQTSWLLAGSLVGGLVVVVSRRSRRRRLAAVLLLWTASVALVCAYVPGKFSPYYLAPLIPGVAALIGMCADEFACRSAQSETPNRAGDVRVGAATLVVLIVALGAFSSHGPAMGWLRQATIGLAALCLVAIGFERASNRRRRATASDRQVWPTALSRAVAGSAIVSLLVVVPSRWTLADITRRQDSVAPDAVLDAPPPSEQLRTVQGNDLRLLHYAIRHQGRARFVLATPRIGESAQAVIQGHSPVPLGGFFGSDPWPTLPALQHWIRAGQLRWVALPSLFNAHSNWQRLLFIPTTVAQPWGPWVRRHCARVPSKRWGGVDERHYWERYRLLPLHAPLVLYDCGSAFVVR